MENTGLYGGAAGYCPRVPYAYYTAPFIAIARKKTGETYIDLARLM